MNVYDRKNNTYWGSVKSNKKTMIEFLETLEELTKNNVLFMKAEKAQNPPNLVKYFDEIAKVQEVINDLEFDE